MKQVFLLLIIALVVFASQSEASTRTVRGTRVKVGGAFVYRTEVRVAARTGDSVYCPFTVNNIESNPCDTILFHMHPYTAKATTDSAFNIGIRLQGSSDGSTWSTIGTVGTDSTTWSTATGYPTFTSKTVQTFGVAVWSSWLPYYRWLIIEAGANKVGGRVRLDVTE